MTTKIPSKKHIAEAFSKRATRYRSAAFIQEKIISHCLSYICEDTTTSQLWLDAGCGAGNLSELLALKSNKLKIISADIALMTLKQYQTQKKHAVNADIEKLPFDCGSFNGVVASSVLQWLLDINIGLSEIKRVLANDGKFVFGVFMRGAFKEFVTLLEMKNMPVPVRYFTQPEFMILLEHAGFCNIEYKIIQETFWFPSAWDVLLYFSTIGSTPQNGPRLSKKELLDFCTEYESLYKTEKGVPLSCSVCVGKAIKK